MRVYWKILTSAIIFVVTKMIITFLSIHLYRSLPFPFPWERPVWFLYVDLLDWIGFLVYPILFVVASYFLGKNLDLKRNLRAAMIPLFIGCFTGHLIGNYIWYLYSAVYMIPTGTDNYIAFLFWFMFSAVINTVISFLIGFSGLALGYLRMHGCMELSKQTAIILSLDCTNGFILGLSLKFSWALVAIGNTVIFLFLCLGLYMIMEKSEAKKRVLTSFDQMGMLGASFLVLLIIGLIFVDLGWQIM